MTEEIINQKYIKISYSNFFKDPFSRSTDSHLRSLEAYLVRNNRTYNISEQTCVVYVYDKNDAMSIGLDLNLGRVEYFDGLELLPLVLKVKKEKLSKSRGVVVKDASGTTITMKKLREQTFKELTLNCLEKNDIVERKILTRNRLESAITEGKLIEINVGSKYYINRQDLANFIKNNKT